MGIKGGIGEGTREISWGRRMEMFYSSGSGCMTIIKTKTLQLRAVPFIVGKLNFNKN